MEGIGSGLMDALEARIKTVLPAVPMLYKGEQGSATDYILVTDDNEEYSTTWSDKDGHANDCTVVLQFWGSKPRTLSGYAKTLIDSLGATPLTVSGFYHLRTVIERNQGLPMLSIQGQANQYCRRMQIRFYYHPNNA